MEPYTILGQSGRTYIYLAHSPEEALSQHERHALGKNDPPTEEKDDEATA